MKDTKAALIWITDILTKHQIPFQITGGLAAIAYGAFRPLEDIDIDIPDDKFNLLEGEVRNYIVYGPTRFKSEKWDLLLMTLNYQGQDIDLSGADQTSIFDDKTNQWIKVIEDLPNATIKTVFELQLPVIPYEKLINYKKILSREVDLIDIQQLESKVTK